jgi:YbbR domain-containing protein
VDKKSKNQEIVVRIICLILSFCLWLYISNVENPNREYKLEKVPVELTNVDVLKNYMLEIAPNQNFYVTLNLVGPANEIYKITREQFKVVVDLSKWVLKKGENNIQVQIVNAPSNISIKNNGVLTIKIVLDDYLEKNIPIKSDVKVSTKQGIYAQEPRINPINAVVSGPAEYVSKVKYLTVKGEVKNGEQEVNMTLPVVAVDEDNNVIEEVKVNPSNAQITIPINKGKIVPINVTTKGNVKDGMVLKTLLPVPDKVELIGDEKILENINSVDTEAIDLSQVVDSKEVNVPLKIPPNTNLTSAKKEVAVKIVLAKVITKEYSVNVSIKSIDDGLMAQIAPEAVTVTLKGIEDSFSSMKAENLKAEVNLAGMKEGEYLIAPTVTNTYSDLTVLSFAPEKIKVTISKK